MKFRENFLPLKFILSSIIELVFRLIELLNSRVLVFLLAGVLVISTLGTFFFQFSSPFFFSAANLKKRRNIFN